MHDIDVCFFLQGLFIINLIKNLGLKLVNSINRGLNFPTALNCIACLDDHLLVKCSLWSFLNDYFYIIKLCYMFSYLVFILIAFYLCFIHALCSTCLVLNEVYLLCASVSRYRCIWFKFFTTFRFSVSEFFPYS